MITQEVISLLIAEQNRLSDQINELRKAIFCSSCTTIDESGKWERALRKYDELANRLYQTDRIINLIKGATT